MISLSEIPACENCGQRFYRPPDESYKTECIICWKEGRGYRVSKSDEATIDLAEELAGLLEEPQALLPSQAIPPNIVKRLRGLVHPDRWTGTPQERSATIVTQWLQAEVCP